MSTNGQDADEGLKRVHPGAEQKEKSPNKDKEIEDEGENGGAKL